MSFKISMSSTIIGRTGNTRQVRGVFRFWKKFTQHEVIVEVNDPNFPRNRSQHKDWVTESEQILSLTVFGK